MNQLKQRQTHGKQRRNDAFLPCGAGGMESLEPEELNARKLFVDKVGLHVTSEMLYEKFVCFCDDLEDAYIMEAVMISNRFRDRSRGYGFVTFSHELSAKRAVETGVEFDGLKAQVRYAGPKPKSLVIKKIVLVVVFCFFSKFSFLCGLLGSLDCLNCLRLVGVV